jgi:hypothetical protein
LSGAVILLVTGEAVSNSDILCEALTVTGVGATPPDKGTAFPASPGSYQRFLRTDLGYEFFWDGTRWLSMQEFIEPGIITEALQATTATTPIYRWQMRRDFGIYLTKIYADTYVSTTSSGSHYYDVSFTRRNAANASVALGTPFATSADTASNWADHTQTINAVLDAGTFEIQSAIAKTGTPGAMYLVPKIGYRLIGP